jgi:membrane protein DedA with SNARE-associated domain
MPLPRYLPALVVGGVAWALIYSTIGMIGFELVGRLYSYSPGLAIAALVALIGSYVFFIVWRTRRPVRD